MDFHIQNSNDNKNDTNDCGAFFCDFSELMELSENEDKTNNNSDDVVHKGGDVPNPEAAHKSNSYAIDNGEKQGSKKGKTNDGDININSNDEFGNKIIIDNYIADESDAKFVSENKLKIEKIRTINARFDNEIMKYVSSIIPNADSLKARIDTINKFKDEIKIINEHWKVYLYGSFSQGISTIYSDLDFVVLCFNKGKTEIDFLKIIISKIIKNKFSEQKKTQLFENAIVPIIRCVCSDTGIYCDISVNKDNGPKDGKIMRKIINEYKILKPALIILKMLLRKNKLNITNKGGMCCFTLRISFLIYMSKEFKLGFTKKL